MSNLAQAVAEQQEGLPLNIENPPEAINLEIPVEEGAEVTTPEPEKKRGRPPANVIITSLKNEKTELLTANERLQQELEEERRQAKEAKTQLATQQQSFTRQNITLNEQRLKSDSERARQLFREARIAADPDKEAEATALIARTESGLADIEAWKASHPEPQQQQPQQQQPQQEQPQYQAPSFDPDTKAWIDENPWFSQIVNGKENPEFNATMHMHAVAFGKRIENEYISAGKREMIGKAEYFQRINDKMAQEFPEAFGEPEEEIVVERPKAPNVAPAVRSSPASKTGKSQTVSLTGQERAFVDNLREGGSMKYPKGHANAGQRMSPMDSYISYWKEKQKGTN